MAALLPVRLSSGDRKLAAVEDLDLGITQTLAGKASASGPAGHSRIRYSGTGRDGDAAIHPRSDEPRVIAGYELVRRLGYGGMGVVYEARDANGEHVALKTIGRRFRDAEASLRREVRALRRLDHPGVVRLHREGSRRREPFFTMDLLPGPTLDAVLARGSQDLLTILRRIAASLAFVHASGIVHRDLTPSNILFRAPDQPVLVDFGLAAQSPAPARRQGRKGEGGIVGTLAYLAPEQIRGQRVDARADLYAFGCILYQALTGRVPFNGNHRATVLRQHLEAAPCPPSLLSQHVPAALEHLTLRLLAKTPAERPESASEIVALFDSLGATG